MSKKLAAMLKQKTETNFIGNLDQVPEEEKPAEPAPVHEHKQYLPQTTSFSGANKCCICSKTVYKTEEMIAVGKVWHNTCFTCGGSNSDGCGRVLKRDGYVDHDCQPYCNACYNKQFKTKGFGIGTGLNTDFGQNNSSNNLHAAPAPAPPAPEPAPVVHAAPSSHYTPGGFQGVGAAAKLSATTTTTAPRTSSPPPPPAPRTVTPPPAVSTPPRSVTPEPPAPTSAGTSNHYVPGGFQGVGAAAKLSPAAASTASKPEPKYTPTNSVPVTSQTPKCTACAKSVYKVEEIIAVGRVWHLTCFTCGGTKGEGCKKVLKRDGYVDHENQPFCNACYAKLYKPKGFGYGNTLSTDYGPSAQQVTTGVSNLNVKETSAPAPPTKAPAAAAPAPPAPERRPSTNSGFQGVGAVAASSKPAAPPAPTTSRAPVVSAAASEPFEEESAASTSAPARRPSGVSNVAPFSEETISKFKQPTIIGVDVPNRRPSLNIGGSTQANKSDKLHKEAGYVGDNDEVDESEW